MLKCFSLAQADAHVTKELIETEVVQVQSLVEMLSQSEYRKALSTDPVLKEFDRLLRENYGAARESNFEFKKDSFGGCGLYYVGDEVISPKNSHPVKVLPSVIGFVEKIPKEALSSFKDISIFRKTDSCSFDRVMLGSTRFANHSCKPNCRFILKEINSRRCIQLEVIKNIFKNDEITVFYGSNFFGEGNQNCLCEHRNEHQHSSGSFSAYLKAGSRARLVLRPISIRSKRQSILKAKWRKKSRISKLEMRRYESDSSSVSSDNDSLQSSTSTDELNCEPNYLSENLVSSPNRQNDLVLPDFFVSTLDNHRHESSSDTNDDNETERSCNFSLHNFSICVNEIVSETGCSDAQASSWLKLVRTAFPEARIPTYKSKKKKFLQSVNSSHVSVSNCAEGECSSLDFSSDLFHIIKSNINAITEYSLSRDAQKDIVIPPTFNADSIMTISLAMNSDGVRMINSRKKSLWPLWLSVLNLPPTLRCMFVNIVLAKLWFGRGKPDWKIFFDQIKEGLDRRPTIEINGVSWTLMFEVKILVADLPAKASILNIKQFNAYFGCSLCLTKCKSIGEGKKGLFYPNQRNKMRTKERHEEYLNLIQNEGLSSFRGVKGPSAAADIVDNLPLSAPIDYMHQVLLGVTRTLLFAVKNKTNKLGLGRIRKAVEGIQLTSDFKRSLRSLDELENFKTNELKVWLLYIGPVVLVGNVNAVLYEMFHLLSYITRLLLFSTQHCLLAYQLIKRFHSLTAEAHTEKFFLPTFTLSITLLGKSVAMAPSGALLR